MKRVYADISNLGQQQDEEEGNDSTSERGDDLAIQYDEMESECEKDEAASIRGSLCTIDPLSRILAEKRFSRCVSTSNQTEDKAVDSDGYDEDSSPTSSTHLLREGDEDYCTEDMSSSSAAESGSPGMEGGIDGANLGGKIQIPKLQLDLLPDQPLLTRRAQSSSIPPLSSAHTQLISPAVSKFNEKIYDQIEDLGFQICENVKSLGEKYAAQKEKADFHKYVNKQLAEKYERALQETEVLENEITRIRNEVTERPQVTLYSLMMELRTPKLEDAATTAAPEQCISFPHLSLPDQPTQKRRHYRSMSVESQAEIRFICREPPKVTVGVGDDLAPIRNQHRRYKSMEVSRVSLEAAHAATRSLETEACVQIEASLPHKNLLQRLKEALSNMTLGRTFSRAASSFSVQPPCPRIICGESL